MSAFQSSQCQLGKHARAKLINLWQVLASRASDYASIVQQSCNSTSEIAGCWGHGPHRQALATGGPASKLHRVYGDHWQVCGWCLLAIAGPGAG